MELHENAKKAVAQKGIWAEVTKVENPVEIMKYKVTGTPGLVINGEVKSTGKVLSPDEIVPLL